MAELSLQEMLRMLLPPCNLRCGILSRFYWNISKTVGSPNGLMGRRVEGMRGHILRFASASDAVCGVDIMKPLLIPIIS